MIGFTCPGCGKSLRVKGELAGKKAKCPACGGALVVPPSMSPPPAITPATRTPPRKEPRPPARGTSRSAAGSAKPRRALLVGAVAGGATLLAVGCVLTVLWAADFFAPSRTKEQALLPDGTGQPGAPNAELRRPEPEGKRSPEPRPPEPKLALPPRPAGGSPPTDAAATGKPGDTGRADEPVKKVQEWRVLLIIKPETNLALKGQPVIKARIPPDNIKAVRAAFSEHTPYWVSKVSERRLRWKPEVVISDTPVTSACPIGKDMYWLAPWDIPGDIKKYVPVGKYDGVFVYWKAVNPDGKGLNVGFGWSIGPNENANFAGFTSVHHGPTDLWGRDSETTEIFLHEWQHQLEAFYGGKGVKLPKGGLHGGSNYGYKHHPTLFWKPWYQDFLAGTVREPDGSKTGLGEEAWSLGTIREEYAALAPEFLTPELKKRNLLRNPSFEETGSTDWVLNSWRGNKDAGELVTYEKARDGKRVAVLNTRQTDDVRFMQNVRVKPKTKYLFSGWAKTEDVKRIDNGIMGANLAVMGSFERNRPTITLTGTQDWAYLSFIFDSGERTKVDVTVRLGHHDGLASGKAWFDDLCLIELPARKASAAKAELAKTRSSAGKPTDAPGTTVSPSLASLTPIASPTLYVQHANFQGRVTTVDLGAGEVYLQNATFYVEPGLADAMGISFRSVNYPDHYFVVEEGQVWLRMLSEGARSRTNATFKRVKGLADASALSFESLAEPGRYLRHKGEELRVDRDNGTEQFRRDATFVVRSPLFSQKK